jgi:hypothetical protein
MEKISFPPLVAHLHEQEAYYNQLCHTYEIQHGAMEASALSSWMVQVIEPSLQAIAVQHPEQIPTVFKAFFNELLKILGGSAHSYIEGEYRAAWFMLQLIPNLLAMQPLRLLKAVNGAIDSIRVHQPDKVNVWIENMGKLAPHCSTVDEFLNCGRIVAWSLGLAQLRDKALAACKSIKPTLKTLIEEQCLQGIVLEIALGSNWHNITQPEFSGEAGGFIGYGANFTQAPLVALVDQHIVATDHKTCNILYADSFGKVLLPEVPYPVENVVQQINLQAWWRFVEKYGKKIIGFEDVSSSVMLNSTLVLTRTSSHYLYIFAIPA